MYPRPKAQRRGEAKGHPHLVRVKGLELCTSSLYSWPTNPGRGRGGQVYKGRKWGNRKGREASFEAACQFQTNHFMYIPTSSS